MHCCARNIERLIRILKLRTDLRSRFVACSFPLKSEINELPMARPTRAVLSAINNDCVFAQARSVVNRQCTHRPLIGTEMSACVNRSQEFLDHETGNQLSKPGYTHHARRWRLSTGVPGTPSVYQKCDEAIAEGAADQEKPPVLVMSTQVCNRWQNPKRRSEPPEEARSDT